MPENAVEAGINTQCKKMWYREGEMVVHVENPS
jgi:hypothetical protein